MNEADANARLALWSEKLKGIRGGYETFLLNGEDAKALIIAIKALKEKVRAARK